MIIQFYKCIVCNKSVGCFPNTKLKDRFCSHHSKEDIEDARNKLKEKQE